MLAFFLSTLEINVYFPCHSDPVFSLPEVHVFPFIFCIHCPIGCAKSGNSLYGFAGLRVVDVAGIQCPPGVVAGVVSYYTASG
jgi:hypothetical protein